MKNYIGRLLLAGTLAASTACSGITNFNEIKPRRVLGPGATDYYGRNGIPMCIDAGNNGTFDMYEEFRHAKTVYIVRDGLSELTGDITMRYASFREADSEKGRKIIEICNQVKADVEQQEREDAAKAEAAKKAK